MLEYIPSHPGHTVCHRWETESGRQIGRNVQGDTTAAQPSRYIKSLPYLGSSTALSWLLYHTATVFLFIYTVCTSFQVVPFFRSVKPLELSSHFNEGFTSICLRQHTEPAKISHRMFCHHNF